MYNNTWQTLLINLNYLIYMPNKKKARHNRDRKAEHYINYLANKKNQPGLPFILKRRKKGSYKGWGIKI